MPDHDVQDGPPGWHPVQRIGRNVGAMAWSARIGEREGVAEELELLGGQRPPGGCALSALAAIPGAEPHAFSAWRDGALWLVRERREHVTLDVWLEREPRLPFLETRWVLADVARACRAAERAGLVHGRLSPRQILWFDPGARVTGLGDAQALARCCAPPGGAAADDEARWLAPERAHGFARLEPAGDVWAFGAIAYAMVTGGHPWEAARGEELQRSKRERRPRSPSALREHVPPGLALAILRCLEAHPARRPSWSELERFTAELVTPAQGYEAPQLLSQAEFLLRQGRPDLARERVEAALALAPGSEAGRRLLAALANPRASSSYSSGVPPM